MSFKTFSVEFNELDEFVVEQALKIDKNLFNKLISKEITKVAQQVIISYVQIKLSEDENKDRSNKYKTIDDRTVLIKKANIKYIYADCEWKEKALDAVVDSSGENKSITPEEIFDIINFPKEKRKSYKTELGRFMKKSGVRCLKTSCNGTTRTGYFI